MRDESTISMVTAGKAAMLVNMVVAWCGSSSVFVREWKEDHQLLGGRGGGGWLLREDRV